MIPDFQEDGYPPPGVHQATFEDVTERVGQHSEIRKVQIESLGWLIDLAKRPGVQRLIVNGSFVTNMLEPNDLDCVLLIGEAFFATDREQRPKGMVEVLL